MSDYIEKKTAQFRHIWNPVRERIRSLAHTSAQVIEATDLGMSSLEAKSNLLKIQAEVNKLLAPGAFVGDIHPALSVRTTDEDEVFIFWYRRAKESVVNTTTADRFPELGFDGSRKVLRIQRARKWYQDPQFVAWINSPGVATWHRKGEPVNEQSDVFLHVCGEDGSDAPGYGQPSPPPYIWDVIVEEVRDHFGEDSEVLVWISNEEGSPKPTPMELAREFAVELLAEIGPGKLKIVDEVNASRPSKMGICHSHEFCDANMVMYAAYRRLLHLPATTVDKDEDVPSLVGDDNHLWNDAWDLVTSYGFENILKAHVAPSPH